MLIYKILASTSAGVTALWMWVAMSSLQIPFDLSSMTGLGVLALFGVLGYKVVNRYIDALQFSKEVPAPTVSEDFREIRSELHTISTLMAQSVTLQQEQGKRLDAISSNVHNTNNKFMGIIAALLSKEPGVITQLLNTGTLGERD